MGALVVCELVPCVMLWAVCQMQGHNVGQASGDMVRMPQGQCSGAASTDCNSGEEYSAPTFPITIFHCVILDLLFNLSPNGC